MAKNPPENTQRVIPYLYYSDGRAAIEFLTRAFGFEERVVMPGPGNQVMHAELGLADCVVMLGSPEKQEPASKLPYRHGAVLCYIDDVDAHFRRARAAGAEIVSEPADQFYGDRTYSARDPEGQTWFFHTHVRDVAPEDMKPPGA